MAPSPYVNPYIAGSPVTGVEMFFGREDVFSFVRRNLHGLHRDSPIVLYGQRRTGKTSVLYQMHRHLDARYRCIFIDLHGLSLDGAGDLLWGVANSIRRGLQRDHQLKVTVPDRATFSADPYQTFEATFLDAVWSILTDDHLVLMIDEVVRLDEEMRAGRLNREIFNYLRHLMQHFENLNFIFSIGSSLVEMEKEYALLFSGSLYHGISFLEDSAARALITRPAHQHYLFTAEAVEKILDITSGHPYYTQLLCHSIFDRWMRSPKPEMTVADVEGVLTETIELGSANLKYVWEDSTPEEQGMMAGMAAAMRAGGRPVSVDEIQQVWRHVGVSLPEDLVASAARLLTSREVVAGLVKPRLMAKIARRSNKAYSFTVDLQRLWLEKHRPVDWVKEELAQAAQQWDRSVKQPHRLSTRAWIFGGAIVGIVLVVVPIAVALFNSNTASPPSTGAVSPTPSPSIIFKDGFSGKPNGWSIVSGQGASGRFSDGQYQISLKPETTAYAFATPDMPNLNPAPPNTTIAVSIRMIAGATSFVAGVACRADPYNYTDYEFTISNGFAYIYKYVNDGSRVLDGRSTAAVHASGENRLWAECTSVRGKNAVHLVFSVNGKIVADATDHKNPLTSGQVGLVLYPPGGSVVPLKAKFDNFVLTRI